MGEKEINERLAALESKIQALAAQLAAERAARVEADAKFDQHVLTSRNYGNG